MFSRFSFGQGLVAAGLVIGLVGLVLWWNIPMPEKFPPFSLTALLAVIGGVFEIWRGRSTPQP